MGIKKNNETKGPCIKSKASSCSCVGVEFPAGNSIIHRKNIEINLPTPDMHFEQKEVIELTAPS